MPITFACGCGKTLGVGDELAGRRARCPACRAVVPVPAATAPPPPPAEDDPGFDVVEDEADDHDFRVVDAPAAPPAADPAPPKKKMKPKRKPGTEKPGSLAAMYMAEARHQEERDEARARAAGGKDDGPSGLTLFNVHFTAGMVGGAGLAVTGLLGLAAVFFLKEHLDPIAHGRCMIGGVVCLGLGLLGLARGVLGESED